MRGTNRSQLYCFSVLTQIVSTGMVDEFNISTCPQETAKLRDESGAAGLTALGTDEAVAHSRISHLHTVR
jgi:hypothetical protein